MITITLQAQKRFVGLLKSACHSREVLFSITAVTHDSHAVGIKVKKALNSFCCADEVDWRADLGSPAHGACIHSVCSYTHMYTRIMTHRCVLSKYRQPFLWTSKGEQEKWWGINRKFQFVGQSIITTFEWANWKWTHWELSRVQLNTHSGATVPAEEKKRKEKQKNTYLELNEKSSAALDVP